MCFERCAVRAALVAAASVMLAACAASDDSPQVAYKQADSGRSLEVPPELTRDRSGEGDTGGDGEIAELEQEDEEVLPDFDNVRLRQAGPSAWLELPEADADDIWPQLAAFLRSQGLGIRSLRPSAGVIETDWATRYDSPPPSGLMGTISGFFGAGESGFSDRYQVRLERMSEDGDGVRVFVTHRTAQEVQRGEGGPNQSQGVRWEQSGTGDPAVAAEMQRRLMVYLGIRERRANEIARNGSSADEALDAEYVSEGDVGAVRFAEEELEEARGRLSESLDRLGVSFESVDAEAGLYDFSWASPGGSSEGGGLIGVFGGSDNGDERQDFVVQLRPEPDGDGFLIVTASDADDLDADASGFDGVAASGVAEKALLQRLADAINGIELPSGVQGDGSRQDAPPAGSEEPNRNPDNPPSGPL